MAQALGTVTSHWRRPIGAHLDLLEGARHPPAPPGVPRRAAGQE